MSDAASRNNQILWLLFFFLLAAALAYIIPGLRKENLNLATTRKVEQFTEVYFEGYDPEKKHLQTDTERLVSYSVVNRLGKPATYNVNATLFLNDQAIKTQNQQINIGKDKKWSEKIRFTPTKASQVYKVKVSVSRADGSAATQVITWRFRT